MKISDSLHLLARLAGGETTRKTDSGAQKDRTVTVSTPLPSDTLETAVTRYIKTIDEITSDIIRIADGNTVVTGREGVVLVKPLAADAQQSRGFSLQDIFIYFPGKASGAGENALATGELVIIKDAISSGSGTILTEQKEDIVPGLACAAGKQQEDIITAISKDAARMLAATNSGIGLQADSLNLTRAREKFVVFLDREKMPPLVSVIHQNSLGRVGSLNVNSGGSGAGDIAVPEIIGKLYAFMAGAAAKAANGDVSDFSTETSVIMGKNEKIIGVAGQPADAAMTGDDPIVQAGFDLVNLIKETFSRLAPGISKDNEAPHLYADMKDNDAVRFFQLQSDEGGTFLSDELPGVPIRVMGTAVASPGVAEKTGAGGIAETITERLTSLAEAINGLIGSGEEIEENPDDPRVWVADVRASIKKDLRESFGAALYVAAGEAGPLNKELAGIRLDEKGLLRIDRTVLSNALADKKDETVSFVKDFGTLLNERISYYYNPLASLYAGVPDEAGTKEAGRKEGLSDDVEDKKAEFEKRLNELQMLLESSYELKESFTQKRFTDQNGQDQ